ncbi:MAG TPA: hypothetical protein VKP30_18140 [Polyangiaceae bacterium]|nr:hypothetical protein [Polyangiaceae bacterium]
MFGAIPADGGRSGAGSSGVGGALLGLQTSIGEAGSRSSSVSTAGQSNTNAVCWNPSGQQGLGCYRCPPENFLHFERACTDAHCVPFDNSRSLTKLSAEGRLPPLPTATGGSANATLGASGSESSSVSTGASEVIGAAGNASIPPESGSAGTPASLAAGGTAGTGDSPGVRCDELPNTSKTVYVTGSSAATPFLQEIAQQLAARSTRIVYVAAGSCTGVDAAINRTALRTGPAPAAAASALYWSSSTSTGKRCQLPPAGVVADLGISDVFVQTCPGFELASLESLRVKDAHGPIQTMAFVVPAGSTYSTISAQAAYFVFGFGKVGGVVDPNTGSPIWNDDEYLYVRGPSSGTQAMLAAAIGVPSSRWLGRRTGSSDEVAQLLSAASVTSSTADKALGILAVDYIDSRDLRGQLRILAFQDTDQVCAFFPDSTATARDKRNVRDGHYPIFGPLHLLYRADAAGNPEDTSKREEILDVVGYLSGSKALPNGDRLLDVFAKRGLIPECAMRVTRTKDGGSLVGFSPANPCSCAFERAATGMTKCTECQVQADCKPDESCSMGYCEQ